MRGRDKHWGEEVRCEMSAEERERLAALISAAGGRRN